jgi:hypothetical protein
MDSVKLFWKLISFKTYTFSKILTEFQIFFDWIGFLITFFKTKMGFVLFLLLMGEIDRTWE